MTSGQYREVDLDLLADYIGGALLGTPEEAVVTRLIADDPAWAQAHDALAADMERVRDELASWGPELPMPADVTDRLSAVLATAGPLTTDAADRTTGRSGTATDPLPGLPRQSRRPESATPGPGRPVSPGRDRRSRSGRRRWLRWAGPMVMVAGVAAFAGFTIPQLAGGPTARDNAGNSHSVVAPPTAESAAPHILMTVPATYLVTASGTDYSPETVAAIGRTSATFKTPDAVSQDRNGPVVPGLDRLAGVDALAACLHAMEVAHDRGSIAVEVVDYAAFEGVPALIVAFTDQTGQRWAWVAGPGCGSNPSDPDTRYRTRLG